VAYCHVVIDGMQSVDRSLTGGVATMPPFARLRMMMAIGILLVAAAVTTASNPGVRSSPAGRKNTALNEAQAPPMQQQEMETFDVCRGDESCRAKAVYERAPWTTEREWVSLDPSEPVPGDSGLMGALYSEAENFTVTPPPPGMPPAFNVTTWGRDHYYGATFENTFVHHSALLHSTKDSVGTATSPAMSIPTSGTYYVCVRYEAAWSFETEFTLIVSQGGGAKLTKIYGQRQSPKLWAFGWSLINHEIAGCGANPTPECHWTWGATENWVWEYSPVSLSAGSATFEISVSNTTSKPGMAPLADRNIDTIMLTTNLTDIKMRAINEQGMPLDGTHTQYKEVFAKVTNHGSDDMDLYPVLQGGLERQSLWFCRWADDPRTCWPDYAEVGGGGLSAGRAQRRNVEFHSEESSTTAATTTWPTSIACATCATQTPTTSIRGVLYDPIWRDGTRIHRANHVVRRERPCARGGIRLQHHGDQALPRPRRITA
jgi:hypothetical protein